MRKCETHWAHDMRRRGQEKVTLLQCRTKLAESESAGLPEAPMDELGRGGRGATAEVTLLAQKHGEPAADGIARDAAPVDTPSNDGEIVDLTPHLPTDPGRCAQGRQWRIGGKKRSPDRRKRPTGVPSTPEQEE